MALNLRNLRSLETPTAGRENRMETGRMREGYIHSQEIELIRKKIENFTAPDSLVFTPFRKNTFKKRGSLKGVKGLKVGGD